MYLQVYLCSDIFRYVGQLRETQSGRTASTRIYISFVEHHKYRLPETCTCVEGHGKQGNTCQPG